MIPSCSGKITDELEAFYRGFLSGIVGVSPKRRWTKKLDKVFNEGYALGQKVSREIVVRKNGCLICKLCGASKKAALMKLLKAESISKRRYGRGIFTTSSPQQMKRHLNREHFNIITTYLPGKYAQKLYTYPTIR